jgi:hypothetical protein
LIFCHLSESKWWSELAPRICPPLDDDEGGDVVVVVAFSVALELWVLLCSLEKDKFNMIADGNWLTPAAYALLTVFA